MKQNILNLSYHKKTDKTTGEVNYVPNVKGEEIIVEIEDFLKKISDPKNSKEISEKTKRESICLGEFKNKERSNKNFISSAIVKLDIDDQETVNLSCFDKMKENNIMYAFHTTFSYNGENDRKRVYIPLSRQVNKEEYEKVYDVFCFQFGFKMKDNCGKVVGQCMFLPSHNEGITPQGEFVNGSYYDVEKALSYFESHKERFLKTDKSPFDVSDCKLEEMFNSNKDFSSCFNTFYKAKTEFVKKYLSDYYENEVIATNDEELCRFSKKGAEEKNGLVLYKNGMFYSFHASDEVYKQLMTPFKLLKQKRFNGDYNLTVDFIKQNDKEFVCSDLYISFTKANIWRSEYGKLSDFYGVDIPEKKWLLQYLIPYGNRTVFYGEPSAGKSTMMSDLCLCICHGDKNYGCLKIESVYQSVMYIDLEEEVQDLVRRINNQCKGRGYSLKDMNNFRYITNKELFIKGGNKISPFFLNLMKKEKFDLIVVEPFRKLPDDENSNSKVQIVLDILQRLTMDYNTTICTIAHAGKDTSKGVRGASCILDDTRSQFIISGNNNSNKIIELKKSSFYHNPNKLGLPKFKALLNENQNINISEMIFNTPKDEKLDIDEDILEQFKILLKECTTKNSAYKVLGEKYKKTPEAIRKIIERKK